MATPEPLRPNGGNKQQQQQQKRNKQQHKGGDAARPPRKHKPLLAAAPAPAPSLDAATGNSKFARALASTDYQTREKGLQALQAWLAVKADLTESDMLKIWKGLYFCFWHSDRAPAQADLAARLAGLLPRLPDATRALYFDCFLATLAREWYAIDYHRLDKFLMLARRFLAAALEHARAAGWPRALVAEYASALRARALAPPRNGGGAGSSLGGSSGSGALTPGRAAGLRYHFADILVPELRACAAGAGGRETALAGAKRARDGGDGGGGKGGKGKGVEKLPAAAVEALLEPFIEAMRTLDDKAAISRIRTGVFDELANEVALPSDGAPLAALDAAALAARLFDLGAAADVRAANREALYAASAALVAAAERAAGKRARKGEAGGSGGGGGGSAAAEAAAVDVGGRGKRGSGGSAAAAPAPAAKQAKQDAKAAKRKADAAAPAKAPASPATPQAAAGKKARSAAAAPAGPQEPAAAAAAAASPRTPKPAKKAKLKASSIAFLTPQPADHQQQRQHDAAAAAPQTAPPERRALRSAEQAAAAGGSAGGAGGKKRGVVINLRKNLYHKHGAPPPAPDVRTPQAAKPKGSALKAASTVGRGSGSAGKQQQQQQRGGSGGGSAGKQQRTTPGSAARPKAAAFF